MFIKSSISYSVINSKNNLCSSYYLYQFCDNIPLKHVYCFIITDKLASLLTPTQDKSLYRCMGSFTCHNKFSHYKIGEEGYNNEASMLHHTTISHPQQY